MANDVDHPLAAYVREDSIVPKLDAWLLQLFNETNLDATCHALASAAASNHVDAPRVEAARRKLVDCDNRLAKYRQALDAGADAAVVAGWMSEVRGERLRAEEELKATAPRGEATSDEIRNLLLTLRDLAGVLAEADPRAKAAVYRELGVAVRYDPASRRVQVTAGPCTEMRVGGGT